jgi:hypothetical protein
LLLSKLKIVICILEVKKQGGRDDERTEKTKSVPEPSRDAELAGREAGA